MVKRGWWYIFEEAIVREPAPHIYIYTVYQKAASSSPHPDKSKRSHHTAEDADPCPGSAKPIKKLDSWLVIGPTNRAVLGMGDSRRRCHRSLCDGQDPSMYGVDVYLKGVA